ncbi:MAG: tyrosine-protein phosphatase [Meiothermus sp.]|nr:tyrosine-protein phosphatase [Meiothermus sp.]
MGGLETTVADYSLTGEYARLLIALLETKGHDLEQYRKLLLSEPEFMRDTLEYLESARGGLAGYLEGLGLSKENIGKLRDRLVGPQARRIG